MTRYNFCRYWSAATNMARYLHSPRFRNSEAYWEQRYAEGGNSGVGSYGDLALYKARFLNQLVRERDIRSVIEFGCGDGNQLALAEYPSYIGLDVAPTAIDWCSRRFAGDRTKSFFLYSTLHFFDRAGIFTADMAISLDVLFHLVEDEIFEAYLQQLFASARRYVVIYSSDEAIPDPAPHVRHRAYSEWVEANIDGWRMTESPENPLAGTLGAVAHFSIYERTPREATVPAEPVHGTAR